MKRAILILFLLAARDASAQPGQLVNAFPALSFNRPVFLTNSGDGTNRIFVVQEDGFIKVFPNDSTAASALTFLNLSRNISSSSGEEGLLGLAFDPHFSQNGYFYVDYTARGSVPPTYLQTMVSRFHVDPASPDKADSTSEFVLLRITQPFSNHNGGMLAFGQDGYLYIGLGDGGDAYDPDSNGQNTHVLLGKILRIDVSDTTATAHYRIPPDNPFAANASGEREEIWAYGLRNPWRFSFDSTTGRLWVGDVGQAEREEIDIVERGKNYGWNIMEGTICTSSGAPVSNCDTTGLTLPIKDYDHSLGDAVVGGYVYRGYRRPDLTGDYLYGDNGSGRIWVLRYEHGERTLDSLLMQAPFNISAFGMDEQHELYVVSHSFSTTTSIYRFAGPPLQTAGISPPSVPAPGFSLQQNYPNPFNPVTNIGYRLARSGQVRLQVFDVLGRLVTTIVNGVEAQGAHVVRFDGASLPSGAYYYRVETPGFVGQKAMLLIK